MTRHFEWVMGREAHFWRAALEHLCIGAVLFMLACMLDYAVAHLSSEHSDAERVLSTLSRGISFILVIVFAKAGAVAIGLAQVCMTPGMNDTLPPMSQQLAQALLAMTPLVCRIASFKLLEIDPDLIRLSIRKFASLVFLYSLFQAILFSIKNSIVGGQLPYSVYFRHDLIINLIGIGLTVIQLRLLISVLRISSPRSIIEVITKSLKISHRFFRRNNQLRTCVTFDGLSNDQVVLPKFGQALVQGGRRTQFAQADDLTDRQGLALEPTQCNCLQKGQ